MSKKFLITITTCNRLSEVKKYIWDYLRFVNSDSQFDFVLALDGNNQEYIEFAHTYDIPLIYSDEREGVGLSKNRVLTQFPNYGFYFFLDDDIELLNPMIFETCISLMKDQGYHHLCGNHIKSQTFKGKLNGLSVTYSLTGGGYFTGYSNEGIKTVGGFHTKFAQFQRYGHSEHSYRFLHSGLQKSPFIFFEEGLDSVIIHSPASVTTHLPEDTNKNEWVKEEQELIDNKMTFFPLETISPFHFNYKSLGFNQKVADFLLSHPQKYPLTKGKDRKIALAEHYALQIQKTKGIFQKIALLLKSAWYSPTNVALKHYIKTQLFGKR